uniref:Polyketide synthase n=1 Tax=uncultured bacterium AR_456 TaxID=1630014 RepID=A0A0E3JRM6_9BACT|nr:polyketide synthase [uncultured bacterium AR_456]
MSTESSIAIVGVACRFPGAADTAQFWANLAAGADTVSRFRPDELADPAAALDPDHVPARGVLPGGGQFDWTFFGYSPAEAATIDPQQRVFLECASAAVDDAGIDPARFPGWIGVFAGSDPVLLDVGGATEAEVVAQVLGQDKDYLATRVAYKLGLRGPAMTVQTACSTALTAVHTACQSLLGYECDAALAGGVAVSLPQRRGYHYQEGGILSRDGRCRPFDADAGGTVASEGVGVVVLRRLADAVADGDRIIAVLRGSAMNNDGGDKIGYTAPSVAGQRDVIRLALEQAQVDPADLGYVEAHGTATLLGDPVEVQALTAAFRESTDASGYCLLGSVKGNIGHTGAAAGIAGLIKAALVLEHGEAVPTPHHRRPNPLLELGATPFRIATRHEELGGGPVRLAGVSSFGIGGTNVHAVLASPPERRRAAPRPGPRLFGLSARSATGLAGLGTAVARRLETDDAPRLDDVAWTLNDGRRRHEHRVAVVADSAGDAARELRERRGHHVAGVPRVAFLFPGQGALRDGAAAAAHRLLPAFRADFDQLAAMVRRDHGIDLTPVIGTDADPGWFRDTVHQQLGLFAVGHALGRQLAEWGVTPEAMLGNSIGEYVAATLAGVWTLPDALGVVHRRAVAMRATPPGRMVAVAASAREVAARVGARTGVVVAVEGAGTAVLSGDPAAVEAVLASDVLAGLDVRPVEGEHAFHSPLMAAAAEAVRAAVAEVPSRPATGRLVSNLTGDWAEPDRLREPEYWAEHLLSPVRLGAGAGVLLDHGCDVLVELGPGGSMSATLRRHPGWRPDRHTVSLLGKDGGADTVLRAVGALWELGLDVSMQDTATDERPVRCALPPHPFEPRTPPPRATTSVTARPTGAPEAGLTTETWAQVRTAGAEAHRGLVVVGEAPEELVAALSTTDTAVRRLPAGTEPAVVLDQLDESVTAVLVALPAGPAEAAVDRLDTLVTALAPTAVRVLVAGTGTAAVLDTDGPAPWAALESWVDSRRGRPGRVTVLDLGAEVPRRVPRLADPVAWCAWRGGRWWERVALPVPTGSGRPGRVAVVTAGHADGVAVTAAACAAGLRVTASVALDTGQEPLPLTGELPAAVAGARQADHGADRLSRRDDLRADLDLYCAGLVGRFVLEHGKVDPGGVVTPARLRSLVDPKGMLPRFVDFMTRTLVEQGWLTPVDDGGLRVDPDVAHRVDEALLAGKRLDEVAGLRRILTHCATSYPAVFAGEQERVQVLYPDGDPTLFRDSMTDNAVNPSGDVVTCMDTVRRAVRAAHARLGGRPLRVLEIGAGQGELTWPLMDGWDDRAGLEYHFTDISPLMLRRARARAEELGLADQMRFSIFDLTRAPAEQGLAGGTFDLVLAYNAVHVAPNVREVLGNLAGLLRAGGSLCFIEMTDIARWAHVVWGLTPGWWEFGEDRTDAIMLDRASWLTAMSSAGLTGSAVHATDDDADHVVLAGSVPATPDLTPAGRVAAELRRVQVDQLLYLPAGPAAARHWPALCALAELPGRGVVVTEDPPGADGWRAREWRRELDPPPGGDPDWRHVRVARLGTGELTALAAAPPGADLPGVLRLTAPPPAARRRGRSSPGPAPVVAPVTPARGDPLRDQLAALWCEVLGVPAVEDRDDFFALGGESLMAVHFMGRVRARAGVHVAPAAFTRTPTFGGLVALATQAAGERAADAGDDPSLVVLRPGGTRTPLFLAAPAAGTTLSYRALAGLLDDRPVYGIEPELSVAGEASVEEIAEHHLEVIRRVRPHGPYVLGGWSFGAVVAHELARRLRELGERVDMLVCVDGYVPDTGGRPIRSLRGFHAIGLWYQATAALKVGSAGALVRDAPDVRRVFGANIRAMWRYRPRPVDCPVVVLKTRLDPVRARCCAGGWWPSTATRSGSAPSVGGTGPCWRSPTSSRWRTRYEPLWRNSARTGVSTHERSLRSVPAPRSGRGAA